MRRIALGLVSAAAVMMMSARGEAQPLVAIYTGVLFGTNDAFTATLRYDTKDLAPSPDGGGYLDAKSDTVQSATYSDPFRSVTFINPTFFSKGEYDSTVFDENGAVTEIDTVHAYSISTNSGLLSLSFGGVGDSGIVTFGTDGLDYAELDPRFFQLTKDVVSPVPLPSGAPLFGGALAVAAVVGRARMRNVGRSAI